MGLGQLNPGCNCDCEPTPACSVAAAFSSLGFPSPFPFRAVGSVSDSSLVSLNLYKDSVLVGTTSGLGSVSITITIPMLSTNNPLFRAEASSDACGSSFAECRFRNYPAIETSAIYVPSGSIDPFTGLYCLDYDEYLALQKTSGSISTSNPGFIALKQFDCLGCEHATRLPVFFQ